MTTTALVTDSTSYLPPGVAAELGITVVPLHVTLEGESFGEPDLPPAEFYRRLRASGQAPTTSQPSPGQFLRAFSSTGADRVLGAARSTDEAIDLQVQAVRAAAATSPTRVSVGHGDVPDLADELAAGIADAPGVLGIDRYVVGPVVGAHAGAGNVGASWFR